MGSLHPGDCCPPFRAEFEGCSRPAGSILTTQHYCSHYARRFAETNDEWIEFRRLEEQTLDFTAATKRACFFCPS